MLTIELQLVWCRWIPNGVVRDESWIPGLEGILDGIDSNLSTISKKQTSTLIHALLEHPRWQETHYFIEQPENQSRALFTRLRTASSQMSPAGLGLEHMEAFHISLRLRSFQSLLSPGLGTVPGYCYSELRVSQGARPEPSALVASWEEEWPVGMSSGPGNTMRIRTSSTTNLLVTAGLNSCFVTLRGLFFYL